MPARTLSEINELSNSGTRQNSNRFRGCTKLATSLRQIGRMVGVSHMTAARYLDQSKKRKVRQQISAETRLK